jgi:predicted RNase H-like HicB family nuclease
MGWSRSLVISSGSSTQAESRLDPEQTGDIVFEKSETIASKVVAMKRFKIVVEKRPDTYVAYPLGLKGVVVGQGDTYEAALADVRSAIEFHIETFAPEKENSR